MTYAPRRLRSRSSHSAAGRLGVFASTAAVILSAAFLVPSAAFASAPPASASWHGRAIEDPQSGGKSVATYASFPAGWSAGRVHLGSGSHHPGGSERVREVQRRLWSLGFRPGPIDGIFGLRTRAAVQWFQIKHGLQPDGVVGLRTLSLLRVRTGVISAARPIAEPVRNQRPAARAAAPQPQPAAQPVDRSPSPAGGGGDAIAPTELAALALLLLAVPAALALTLARRRSRREAPKPRRPAAASGAAAAPAPQSPPAINGDIAVIPSAEPAASPEPAAAIPAAAGDEPAAAIPAASTPEPLTAIGYIRSSRDRTELAGHAGAIRRVCTSRGWKLAEIVRDDQTGGGRSVERPGLVTVMERLSAQGQGRLVVNKLAHLSRSAADLTTLFEWFSEHDVQVIAADVGIDTTTAEGRRAAHAVLAKVVQRQAAARANGNGNGTYNGIHDNGGQRNGTYHNGRHANGTTSGAQNNGSSTGMQHDGSSNGSLNGSSNGTHTGTRPDHAPEVRARAESSTEPAGP